MASTAPGRTSPYIPASTSLPEITIKGTILGILLAAILAGANAYLGLFAGMTVSASIPAAVISMGVLRFFKRSNILENNMVQTIASAGEALAAGVIFTLPALVLLGTWTHFNFVQTLLIAGFGGTLGVLFTVPLRRALIVEEALQFPEGVACAQVLETGERGGAGVKLVGGAALVAALYKFAETGLRLFPETWEAAAPLAGRRFLAYVGTNLSPALMAVGYIVGINIAVLVFAGGALNWWIAIPIYTATHGGIPADQTAADYASWVWSHQTRYLGVGAMILGGLWALVKLGGSVLNGIKSGLAAYRASREPGAVALERTDRDIPMQAVLGAVIASIIPIFILYQFLVGKEGGFAMTVVMAIVMVIAGFLFSAVAGYMAGLVGSSNNPISGVTIATIVFASFLLLVLFGRTSMVGPAAAVGIGAVVACAAAIAGDNLQDLKTGYLVGSTPWKQELMLAVGTLVSAFVMAPVLQLLLSAYGIGVPSPGHPHPLAAPQATLMASVSKGVFQGGLPWTMVFIGMGIAAAIIAFDSWQEKRNASFRTPVLAVAVGIYLPFELSSPILVGGLIAWAVQRSLRRRAAAAPGFVGGAAEGEDAAALSADVEQRGLLLASGFITGEALVGIAMAIPIVIASRADVMAFWGVHEAAWPGLVILAIICYGLYRVGKAV